jgi:hypothetical protein
MPSTAGGGPDGEIGQRPPAETGSRSDGAAGAVGAGAVAAGRRRYRTTPTTPARRPRPPTTSATTESVLALFTSLVLAAPFSDTLGDEGAAALGGVVAAGAAPLPAGAGARSSVGAGCGGSGWPAAAGGSIQRTMSPLEGPAGLCHGPARGPSMSERGSAGGGYRGRTA